MDSADVENIAAYQIAFQTVATLAAIVSLVAIVWIDQAFRHRKRMAFYETIRAAVDRGTELTPQTIQAMSSPGGGPYPDIKWGGVWVAVALACLALGAAISGTEGDGETLSILAGVAAFPGFIGLALLIYGFAARWSKR